MDYGLSSTLTAVLRAAIQGYAGAIDTPVGASQFFYTENPDKQVFCITVPHLSFELPAELLLMAHIVDDRIVIDIDTTNKPLADALLQVGIPQNQIVLAWQNI